MTKTELIYEGTNGVRLDYFLTSNYPMFSRAYFEKVIDQGHVFVNRKRSKKSLKLNLSDEIEIYFPPLEPLDLEPVAMDIPILYEDSNLAVIYKKSNLVCHPAFGTQEPTLIHGLLHQFNDQLSPDPTRPGLVHRLDKDTSGVMLIAKNAHVHQALSDQFKERTIKKTYLALVHKHLKETTIDAPIGRSLKDRKKMAVNMTVGKSAVTVFKPLALLKNSTLVEASPQTGRTHQIRVHLQHLQHPIVGDELYGYQGSDKNFSPPRILLHAFEIEFLHPITNQYIAIKAPLPLDFKQALENLQIDPKILSFIT
ncbi:MAG: RluA family pseudouridine synthase [Verrucomicrobia bacterium]|nr:RluA family pseudouridine synthase [Verrucomicrobiota bacterium]NDE62989.1 RluA family pseudouridine synthase [Chlamydiota bacterium]